MKYEALVNHTITSCRSAALLHFPGTYPSDSQLKYSTTNDAWSVTVNLTETTDMKRTTPAKIDRDSTGSNFFSAVLSNGPFSNSYGYAACMCMQKIEEINSVITQVAIIGR